MMMRIERKMVNILDHENRDVVEQFPLGLVREPTAFTSNDPKEMYNNILIYVVGHPPGESPVPAEMHIFQVTGVCLEYIGSLRRRTFRLFLLLIGLSAEAYIILIPKSIGFPPRGLEC